MARAWFVRLLGGVREPAHLVPPENTHRLPRDDGKPPMVACVLFVGFAGRVLHARNVLITRAAVFERCSGSPRRWRRAAGLFGAKRWSHRWSKGSKVPRTSS